MKKYLYLPIILSLFVNISFGQSNSFITQFPDISWGQSVICDLFETYLVAYSDTSYSTHITRVNKYGNLLWDKEIITNNNKHHITNCSNLIKSLSNYYIAWSVEDENYTDSISISKLNFYGEIIKVKKLFYPVISLQLFPLSNGNILLVVKSNNSKTFNFIILNQDLDIVRTNNIMFSDYVWNKMPMIELNNKIIIGTGWYLGYLDENLNYTELMSLQDRILNIISSTNNNIIINTRHNFIKMNLEGLTTWKINHNFIDSEANLIRTYDGVYHCFSNWDGHYISINDEGLILKNHHSGFGYFTNVTPTFDNGFIGISNELRKFAQNGVSFFLKSASISRSKHEIMFDSVKVKTSVYIKWSSGLPGKVIIEFSSDDGTSWGVIDNSTDAVIGLYSWVIPDKISNNCKIQITSIDYPQYAVESRIFRIIPQDQNFITINNLRLYYEVGKSRSPNEYHEVMYWPGGESAKISATYDDGLYWFGKVNNEIRVGGKHYLTNLQAGNIITPDSAADPTNPIFQSWRFRKNWEALPDGTIKSRYQHDYENWPIDLGAQWIDNNYDGIYNVEDGDKPDADEFHWMVMNDMSHEYTNNDFESLPIGIEVQLSIYGYKQNNFLDDVLFKRYLLINKSSNNIEDMYLCYFADNDFGYSHDDFVGCDTTLNLGFTWNAYEFEDIYGFPPPAMGHMIVQGPIVQGEQNESAISNGKRKNGYKNLALTAFGANYKNDPILPRDPANKMDYVNLMKGLNNNGSAIIDPTTGKATVKHVYGDPETGTGWIDGTTMFGSIQPADRKYYITTGPFNLASEDTQEIVIAVLATKGTSNKNSVTELKRLASSIRDFYYSKFPTDIDDNNLLLPNQFQLSQNYPNPFNPTTTITYTIPTPPISLPLVRGGTEGGVVTLKVYDILGREVTTLVNEKQSPGNYKVVFDGKNLSSGVYFYQLITSNFSQTRKMVLIK